MALTVTKKEKVETTEEDQLPEDEEVIEPKKSNREHELELELAEKRGELKALKVRANPNDGQVSHEQTKQLVFNDLNALSDEDFQKKYKHTKNAATLIITDEDNRRTKTEAKRDRAEAEAVSELGTEIGADFYKFKNDILESAADLSDEARQDPARLKRWMKSQYLERVSEIERPIQKKEDGSRRKIAKDFDAPTLKDDEQPMDEDQTDEIKDEIPAGSDISNLKLGRMFNLTSKKEQDAINKRWMPGTEKGEQVAFVEMDLTCNDPFSKEKIVYGDPRRGYERRKIA